MVYHYVYQLYEICAYRSALKVSISDRAGKCMSNVKKIESGEKRSLEWKSFLFITVILFPVLSVVLVGGYGFIVWMLQVFFMGPPGTHG